MRARISYVLKVLHLDCVNNDDIGPIGPVGTQTKQEGKEKNINTTIANLHKADWK